MQLQIPSGLYSEGSQHSPPCRGEHRKTKGRLLQMNLLNSSSTVTIRSIRRVLRVLSQITGNSHILEAFCPQQPEDCSSPMLLDTHGILVKTTICLNFPQNIHAKLRCPYLNGCRSLTGVSHLINPQIALRKLTIYWGFSVVAFETQQPT